MGHKMKLKENIYHSIKKMNNDELALLYDQIRLLERLRTLSSTPMESIPLEKIHEMTSSSKSDWSNSIIEDRTERI